MARWWRGEKASSWDKSEAGRDCHGGGDNLVTTCTNIPRRPEARGGGAPGSLSTRGTMCPATGKGRNTRPTENLDLGPQVLQRHQCN